MHTLLLHPDCSAGAASSISASIEPTPAGCQATFVVTGDMARIIIPASQEPGRYDDLWKTTCFEIFWQHGPAAYREFNLSPSTRWACYDFDDFREGMRNGPAAVEITVSTSATELRLVANIASELALPARVALNGIIRGEDGENRFWALDFPAGKPEFHAATCRALPLEAPVKP